MKSNKLQIVISLKTSDKSVLLISKKMFERLEQSLGYEGSFFENYSFSKYITIYKSPFVYKKAKSTYVHKNFSYLYITKNTNKQKVSMIIKQLETLKPLLDYSFSVYNSR